MADSLTSSSTNHFYSSCHYKYSLINLHTHWILVSVTKHGTSAHTNTVTWDMRDVIFRQTQQYGLPQLLCDSSSVYKYNVSSTILGEETPKTMSPNNVETIFDNICANSTCDGEWFQYFQVENENLKKWVAKIVMRSVCTVIQIMANVTAHCRCQHQEVKSTFHTAHSRVSHFNPWLCLKHTSVDFYCWWSLRDFTHVAPLPVSLLVSWKTGWS